MVLCYKFRVLTDARRGSCPQPPTQQVRFIEILHVVLRPSCPSRRRTQSSGSISTFDAFLLQQILDRSPRPRFWHWRPSIFANLHVTLVTTVAHAWLLRPITVQACLTTLTRLRFHVDSRNQKTQRLHCYGLLPRPRHHLDVIRAINWRRLPDRDNTGSRCLLKPGQQSNRG